MNFKFDILVTLLEIILFDLTLLFFATLKTSVFKVAILVFCEILEVSLEIFSDSNFWEFLIEL